LSLLDQLIAFGGGKAGEEANERPGQKKPAGDEGCTVESGGWVMHVHCVIGGGRDGLWALVGVHKDRVMGSSTIGSKSMAQSC